LTYIDYNKVNVSNFSAEELIITPEGEILHSQGTSFVLTCKAPPNYKNVDFKLKWFDKYNNEITTTVGR
jgi:hypothetical protein